MGLDMFAFVGQFSNLQRKERGTKRNALSPEYLVRVVLFTITVIFYARRP